MPLFYFSFFHFLFSYLFGMGIVTVQELGITSDEALSLEEFPKRAVILGGGCVFISDVYYYIYLLSHGH